MSFIFDEFINFLESMWIFLIFFCDKIFLNNERNVTNFGYIFLTRFHVTHENFSGDWTKLQLFFFFFLFKNGIFANVKKNWKKSYEFWKINKFIWKKKKKYKSPDYLLNNFFCQLIIFGIIIFFQDFDISRSIEIFIESYFWTGMYVLYILKGGGGGGVW